MIDAINEDSSVKMLKSAEETIKANEFMESGNKEDRTMYRR